VIELGTINMAEAIFSLAHLGQEFPDLYLETEQV
jgi:hypothetical protein